MKYVHITDTHLDFLFDPSLLDYQEAMVRAHFKSLDNFLEKIISSSERDILLTGDISSGTYIQSHLEYIGNFFKENKRRLFFVLGNHDFYDSSFKKVKEEVKSVVETEKFKNVLFYLSSKSFFDKQTKTLFVGADGWYDGEYSPFLDTTVEMNDYYTIVELNALRTKSVALLREECKCLSLADARQVKIDIEFGIAAFSPEKIIVLTHVPPFKELSTHKGKISNETWLPCFTSKFFGDMILKVAQNNRGINFHLFCGHSHDKAEYKPLTNLTCFTGHSEYNAPEKSISIVEI
jgi:predicted phosphohydrolase